MLNFGGGQVGPVPFEGSYSVDGNCTFNSRFGGSRQYCVVA
jgi:hypothetical protein